MKRIVSILICLILLAAVFTTFAFAGYSFSDMSEWEIRQVAAAVNEEIMRRHQNESIELADGQYTVGQSVTSGAYIIMLNSSDINITLSDTAGEQLLGLAMTADENSSYVLNRIILNDGDNIDITGNIVLVPYYGQDIATTDDMETETDSMTIPDSTVLDEALSIAEALDRAKHNIFG